MEESDSMTQDIGLVGLAVMGQNLALNLAEKRWKVAVFNRTVSKIDDFLTGPAKGTSIKGFSTLEAFYQSLKRPRKAIFMVKAGAPVDELIEQSLPYLEPGDILIDGGNSFFIDTERRVAQLREKGVLFLGVGISGGEEGARHGPSIMPGGNDDAWPHMKPILQSISAHIQHDPCCQWVGDGGAGHFVKMVHNGIEYADMQLIAETYDILRRGYGCGCGELSKIFARWNDAYLHSYLIEITATIFAKKDVDGQFLLDKVLDAAGQKGTGKWTVVESLEVGAPATVIAEAVFGRALSADYDERQEASRVLGAKTQTLTAEKETFIGELEKALYAAKIICYAQGFWLMRQAGQQHKWALDLGSCALMWRGGCIIRSSFLGKIKEAYTTNPDIRLLILDPYFHNELKLSLNSLRMVVASAVASGIPVPCFSSALAWYDGIRSQRLPTNLIQAQRDFFGAHTFERIDRPRGVLTHADWRNEI
jgi:6-phosphogluconate dehydrogenase